MPGRRRRYLVVPIAAVVLLLLSAGRAFAWTSPVGVSPFERSAGIIGAAIDSTGRATVAWDVAFQSERVQARVRRPDGSLGFIRTVGEGQFGDFAADGSGNSYFVWRAWDGANFRIYFRELPSTGTFGPTLALSPPGGDASQPSIAVNASGEAIVAWEVLSRIQVSAVSSGGTPSPRQTINPSQTGSFPEVAIDPSGDSTIAWNTNAGIAAMQRDSSGTLGPVIPVDSGGAQQVAMDTAGNATLLYERGDDLDVRQLSSAGALGPRLEVGALPSGDFTFGLDGSGTALIAWTPGFTGIPRDRTLSPSGSLGPVQLLSDENGSEPALGIDSSGDSVIAWREQDAGTRNTQVRAVERAAGGSLGPTETISGAARARNPVVGINDAGQAIAAWNAARVQISAGP